MNIVQIPCKDLQVGDLILDEYEDELSHQTEFIERIRSLDRIENVLKVVSIKIDDKKTYCLIKYERHVHINDGSHHSERSVVGYIARYLKGTYFAVLRYE